MFAHGVLTAVLLASLSATTALAESTPDSETTLAERDAPSLQSDDTPDIDTETTAESTAGTRLTITGDLRPIFDYFDLEEREGHSESESALGARLRVRADVKLTDALHIGTRAAGVCFDDGCDLDVVVQSASDGIDGGTLTLDELFLHWSPVEEGSVAVGRLQTRFVLRGGVYAKSLDRNDSNNVNITWTDGMQASYRTDKGWNASFVLQRNSREGASNIRRDPLDFNDGDARITYFAGIENTNALGNIVQRGFDVSYLPASLLKDGDPGGRREDYWGLVGRMVLRFPQRSQGMRLRTGVEIGYAPDTQTREAARLDSDVSGLAWDVVASIMEFAPGHSIGINYARTGAGWLISPQYRPNEELFEIRYQWRPNWGGPLFRRPPLVEPRFRWREELVQLVGAAQKRKVFDMYIRLTWEF